tara:strand:+ start:408 stop:578 length:171 start_codon:yes stop_codon:yes gene_type:complete
VVEEQVVLILQQEKVWGLLVQVEVVELTLTPQVIMEQQILVVVLVVQVVYQVQMEQ